MYFAIELSSLNAKHIEWIQSFDLTESPKVGIVECQDFANPVLNHKSNKAYIVRLLSNNSVFGDQAKGKQLQGVEGRIAVRM